MCVPGQCRETGELPRKQIVVGYEFGVKQAWGICVNPVLYPAPPQIL